MQARILGVAVLLLLLSVSCFGQAPTYTAFYESNLTASATALTIQQPATPLRTARIVGAMVYCSAACTITLEHATTGATTTALAGAAVSPGYSAPTILARRDSNVAAGTVVTKYTVGAGETKAIESAMVLQLAANYSMTLRSAVMTGTVRITWVWTEE